VAIDLGRRAGLAIDNTRLYQTEHRIAETLRRSLLPNLPALPGLEIAARYRACEDGTQVGGDFCDVFALPDGAIAIVIGDVVGHDPGAGAAMGHLRGLIRAIAWDAETTDRADRPRSSSAWTASSRACTSWHWQPAPLHGSNGVLTCTGPCATPVPGIRRCCSGLAMAQCGMRPGWLGCC
jgi:hypothetical protein